jgi:DNA-binding CsgD family transcriptional regulator
MTLNTREADPHPDRAAPNATAAEQVRASWQSLLPSQGGQLRASIVALPGDDWERDPELLLALATTYRTASSLNLYAANSYLDAADALIDDDDERLRAMSALQRTTCLRGFGRLEEAHELALTVSETAWRDQLRLSERLALEARGRIAAGISLALLGDLPGGEAAIRHGLGLVDQGEPPWWVVEALGWLAIIAWHTGPAAGPLPHLTRAHELGEANGMLDDVAGVPARIAESLLATDRGDFALAMSTLAPLAGITVGTEYDIMRLHALSLASISNDSPLDQVEVLQEARILLQAWPEPSLYHLQHETCSTIALLRAGALTSARESISALAALTDSIPDPRHIYCVGRFEARLAMQAGEYETVIERTDDCRAIGDGHAVRTLAYVDVLRAAAHLQLGDTTIAATSIDNVMVVAARTGWQRPLLLLPSPVLRLMIASADAREQPDAVRSVINELSAKLPEVSIKQAESLTERERVILAHLAAGRSRKEISTLLHVSPNTIKSQTRNLYHKLGAASKHEAIARAEQYGISI